MIHEGTNGIQSLDLLGRKVKTGLSTLVERVAKDIKRASVSGDESLSKRALALDQAMKRLVETTDKLVGKASNVTPRLAFANSHEYLNMAGHTVIAWMWLRQEIAAAEGLKNASEEWRQFFEGKRFASQYFFQHELPKTVTQSQLLNSLDSTVVDVKDNYF